MRVASALNEQHSLGGVSQDGDGVLDNQTPVKGQMPEPGPSIDEPAALVSLQQQNIVTNRIM